ncbi:MAG: quinoprotein dehydrogenase-associated putative ABC transporter substrate-binding protein [Hyphomicrobiaceae bacterium]
MKAIPLRYSVRFCYFLVAMICMGLGTPSWAQSQSKANKALDAALAKLEAQLPLAAVDHTALRKAATQKKLDGLRVCSDPGNMPLSDIDRQGFQNKIIELVAEEMGTRVSYFWRPSLERGITRQTFESNDCDVLLDMPEGYSHILTTTPVYRTTYVFAYRSDKGIDIKSLDDPKLKDLRIGVFQTSGLRMVLASRGVRANVSLHVQSHNPDLIPENQPWRQVQKVVDGELDVAGVWGPFAGWLKTMKGAPLVIQPVNIMEDEVPLEFDLSIGLRKIDYILKYKIELALDQRKAEIEKILRSFGVPLVNCSRCTVQGDLPAHGVYTKPIADASASTRPEPAPDQKVDTARLESWLASGADINQELANAVLAADLERIKFLIAKGADVNKRDPQGYAPIHTAARHRHPEIVALLAASKADVNAPDVDGMTALVHAVARDHPATIKQLVSSGADLNSPAPGGYPLLALAIVEDKLDAAMALIASGAPINAASGSNQLTPLMLVAGKEPVQLSLGAGRRPVVKLHPQYPGSLEVAKALIDKGADLDATNAEGVTALMLAAAHNQAPIVGVLLQANAKIAVRAKDGRTALEIAKANGNETVVSTIRLMEQSGNN